MFSNKCPAQLPIPLLLCKYWICCYIFTVVGVVKCLIMMSLYCIWTYLNFHIFTIPHGTILETVLHTYHGSHMYSGNRIITSCIWLTWWIIVCSQITLSASWSLSREMLLIRSRFSSNKSKHNDCYGWPNIDRVYYQQSGEEGETLVTAFLIHKCERWIKITTKGEGIGEKVGEGG